MYLLAESIESVTMMEKYGFPGLVVGFLFLIIMFAGKWALNHYTIESQGWRNTVQDLDDRHRTERLEWRQEHREDRQRWREDDKAMQARLAETNASLSKTMSETHETMKNLPDELRKALKESSSYHVASKEK